MTTNSSVWSVDFQREHRGVLTTAAWFCVRWMVIGVAAYLLWLVLMRVQAVLLALVIAVLLASLLSPLVSWLSGRGWSRWLATTTVLIIGLAGVGGVLTFVVVSFARGVPQLRQQLTTSVRGLRAWAVEGPLGLNAQQMGGLEQQVGGWVSSNQQNLAGGALSAAGTVGGVVSGSVLVLFALVFFLHHGSHLWTSLSRLAAAGHRSRVESAGRSAFRALVTYTRARMLVALASAAGIGVGLFAVGVPVAGPLTALVFLGGLLPVLGALVAGGVAVLVTLVTNGLAAALIVLGVVLVVEQLEGNVLHPWLLGDAAKLHPLTVVVSVTAGVTVGGVVGALLAVPLVTTVRAFLRPWLSSADEQRTEQAPVTGESPDR